jgi:hypothetical protein
LHFGRSPVGDFATEVECHHPIGNAHHQTHVMLNQQDGGAEPVANADDQLSLYKAERPSPFDYSAAI